jgi:hypothetical protein
MMQRRATAHSAAGASSFKAERGAFYHDVPRLINATNPDEPCCDRTEIKLPLGHAENVRCKRPFHTLTSRLPNWRFTVFKRSFDARP